MKDIEKALLNPAMVFKNPRRSLKATIYRLSKRSKFSGAGNTTLGNCKLPTKKVMTAPKPEAVTLDMVLKALHAVGAPPDVERTAPTKQGGS